MRTPTIRSWSIFIAVMVRKVYPQRDGASRINPGLFRSAPCDACGAQRGRAAPAFPAIRRARDNQRPANRWPCLLPAPSPPRGGASWPATGIEKWPQGVVQHVDVVRRRPHLGAFPFIEKNQCALVPECEMAEETAHGPSWPARRATHLGVRYALAQRRQLFPPCPVLAVNELLIPLPPRPHESCPSPKTGRRFPVRAIPSTLTRVTPLCT